MTDANKPVLALNDCVHIGIEVNDFDKAADFLSKVFGWGPWENRRQNAVRKLVDGGGKPGKVVTNGAAVNVNNYRLDITSAKGQGCRAEFTSSCGGGLHHLGFMVDDVKETVARLEHLGAKFLDAAVADDGTWLFAFVDLQEVCTGKIVLELIQRS